MEQCKEKIGDLQLKTADVIQCCFRRFCSVLEALTVYSVNKRLKKYRLISQGLFEHGP